MGAAARARVRRPVRRARWPTLGSTGGAVAPRCRQPPARTEPSVQALCPCATMWLVKAPKPPLDEQNPQASIAPGDITDGQRGREAWREGSGQKLEVGGGLIKHI